MSHRVALMAHRVTPGATNDFEHAASSFNFEIYVILLPLVFLLISIFRLVVNMTCQILFTGGLVSIAHVCL